MKNKKAKSRIFHYNFFKKNRMGSHVGVILSFAIFITSLVYIYSVIAPSTESPRNYQFVLDNLMLKLNEEISGDLTLTSVYVTTSITGSCLEFQNLKDFIGGDFLVVEDSGGNFLDYAISGTNIKISVADSSEKLFKIYSSNEFTSWASSLGSCQQISSSEYSVGLVSTKKYVFKNKIEEIIDAYQYNYDELKNNLGVLSDNDFSFSFTYFDGSSSDTGESTLSRSIYVNEEKTKYFDVDEGINVGVMRVKVW